MRQGRILTFQFVLASHPGAVHLDWSGLQTLTDGCCMPVYALGGMHSSDLAQAWRAGVQGIAAIRGLWPELQT